MFESKKNMQLMIGCDHAAYSLKETLKLFLENRQINIVDVGTYSKAPIDYPDIASIVASQVSNGIFRLGILMCGTGIGMSMVANRFSHVRAALCNDSLSATMGKQHNNSNILVMGARIVTEELAIEITKSWLEATFEKGRHQRRLNKFDSIQEKHC